MPAFFAFYLLLFLLLAGLAACVAVSAKWVIRFPLPGAVVLAILVGGGLWNQAAITSNDTTPDKIREITGLPIPDSAVNCYLMVDGFEDTMVYMRCDIPASATGTMMAASTWAQPVVGPRSRTEQPWPNGNRLPTWWSPAQSHTWIEVPAEVIGGNAKEPTTQSMLIDTTNPDVHRVFITRLTP